MPLGKGLVNLLLVTILLNKLLVRSFGFVDHSLDRSLVEALWEKRRQNINTADLPINRANMPTILTAAGTVLPPVPTRTWADTPTTPNLNLPLVPYCHRTVNLTMIAPISLRPTDQPIDRTKCLTDCHHLPLAPYCRKPIRIRYAYGRTQRWHRTAKDLALTSYC